MNLPNNPNESLRRRNPHLYPPAQGPTAREIDHARKVSMGIPSTMVRQSSKGLNKTEAAFLMLLQATNKDAFITQQAITFRLANGLRYTPDFVLFHPIGGTVDAFEVKGFMRDDAAAKIKMAATVYPFIKWTLAWKKNGLWKTQIIME